MSDDVKADNVSGNFGYFYHTVLPIVFEGILAIKSRTRYGNEHYHSTQSSQSYFLDKISIESP